jgi:uncharacterized protein (TIGR02217 family)
MAHYDNVILPLSLSFGTTTGPKTSTDVSFTDSGFRKANRRWSQHLRRFNLRYAVRSPEDVYTLLKLFEAVDGPANSFLLRDWNDWNTTDGRMGDQGADFITATDQPLQNTVTAGIVGDGTTFTFQMRKDYTVGGATHSRTIKKPQSGTIKVAVDGVVFEEGGSPDGYSVDYATGVVTFASAPGAVGSPTGVPVTWGGAFYVPVAFEGDEFIQSLDTHDASSVPDIRLIEERL